MNHRIVFTGVWMLFAAALIVFPGFEVRGWVAGMIVGYWPALISVRIGESQYGHPLIFLVMMLILSGATVGLFAWLLDQARMPKTLWIALGVSIVLGVSVVGSQGLSYEQWQKTPSIAQAMEAANDYPSHGDFIRDIVIPHGLAGGLWGLYGIEALCVLCSVAILLKRVITGTQADKQVDEEPQ